MPRKDILALVGIAAFILVGMAIVIQSPLPHGQEQLHNATAIVSNGYDANCGAAGLHENMTGTDGPDRSECRQYDGLVDKMNLKEWHLSHDAYVADQESVYAHVITEDERVANDQKRTEAGHYRRWNEWNAIYNADCYKESCYSVDKLIKWKQLHPDAQ